MDLDELVAMVALDHRNDRQMAAASSATMRQSPREQIGEM
jgi:hypothetical protein